eukprot:INCI1152.1.p1 GENE.INCI1152.1~~INCI1152.1.p1  ORF type:complete len:100 (-),score=19.01 INCI1152.1:148-447(-)
MRVQVRLFAKARDAAGTNKCVLTFPPTADTNEGDVEAPPATVSLQEALAALLVTHSSLSDVLPSCSLAVNEAFVGADTVTTTRLKDNDTLAILPPVSGG